MLKRSTKRILALPAFILMFFIGVAQIEKRTDSLLQLLKTQKEDTSKVNTIIALVYQYISVKNFSEAQKKAEEGISLAKKINSQRGIAASYHAKADVYNWMDNWGEMANNNIVSLVIYRQLNEKEEIYECLKDLIVAYNKQGKFPEEMTYALEAIKIAEETGDTNKLTTSNNMVADLFESQSRFSEALKYYSASLKIYKETGKTFFAASSCLHIGRVYSSQKNYAEALKSYLEALRFARDLNDKQLIANIYHTIGIFYSKQMDFTEALKNYHEAHRIRELIGNKERIAYSYNSIGDLYSMYAMSMQNQDSAFYRQELFSEAIKNHQAALAIAKETGLKSDISFIYQFIGDCYSKQERFIEALKNYLASFEIRKELKQYRRLFDLQTRLGYSYIKLKKFQTADQILKEGLNFAKETGYKEGIKLSYEYLAHLNEVMLNWKQANEYNKLFVVYRDSLNNKESSETTLRMSMQYEFGKKEDSLTYKQLLTSLALKKQKQVSQYLITGFILLFLLSFFIYRNYRTRQQLKLQTLRNKIAIDLHDDVGSTLSSISIFSQMAQQQSKDVIPLLETIGDNSRKMLEAMADIVWSINPENDQFEKIVLRMKNFAYELLGAKGIDFEFLADDDVTKMKLTMEVRKNLYLIFKEATNNMVKYSEADKVLFSITEEKNILTMIIKDNGKGFDKERSISGNGLNNMKKRAEEMGGQLVIDSKVGNGTLVELKIAV